MIAFMTNVLDNVTDGERILTKAVLSPGNRAKSCKFRYVKPVGNFIRKL